MFRQHMNKERIGIILGYYAFVAFLFFALFYYFTIGSKFLLINNIITCIAVAIITYFLKKQKLSYLLFSHLLVIFSFLSLFTINLVLGGIDSPMNYWFLATILGSGFMLTAKWMILWGVSVVLVYISFIVMKLQSIRFDFQITLDESHYLLYHFNSLVGVITLILLFSWSYISITEQYSKKIKDGSDRNNMLIKILNHDLASPLTIIDAYVRTLDQSTLEKAKPKLLRANQSISDILSSIRSIDKFHTITPGLKEVKLKETIEDILPEIKELYAEKNLSYVVDIHEELEVCLDAEIFKHQIIKNLLTNASKFSHEKGKISIVFFKNQLSITDQGIGIPKSMIEDLFEYDKNTSRHGTQGEKGTGFGLPLVKDCCDKMNIKIDVLSNSSGTTFSLSFLSLIERSSLI